MGSYARFYLDFIAIIPIQFLIDAEGIKIILKPLIINWPKNFSNNFVPLKSKTRACKFIKIFRDGFDQGRNSGRTKSTNVDERPDNSR